MNFAVIKTGGKQYKVAEGDILAVEKLSNAKVGDKIKFEEVLLVEKDGKTEIGTPFVKGAVEAEFIEEGLGVKKLVLRYKNKVNYRKLKGHRQPYSKVKILKI